MDVSQLLPLGEEVNVTCLQVVGDQLHLQVASTSSCACCPVCAQPATRIHSHYWRRASDLPCAGRQARLLWRVRKFFCETLDCPRKIFAERFTHLAPWAQMTTRLSQVIQAIGLATCGRLGARLAARLGIATSWMTILRRVMALAPGPSAPVSWLGIDDFSFQRGRTFGTVLVDLERHQLLDLLPDRQVETAAAWMRPHPEIEGVSRDRGKDYAAAATSGAPQAVQVADRFHIAKNLTEAVQVLLARVLTELQEARQAPEAPPAIPEEHPVPVQEWRPVPGRHVQQVVATRRAEREGRYHEALTLRSQGLPAQDIAARLYISARTVRRWFHRGAPPDVKPRRKYQSAFDAFAPYVLQRWQAGVRNGMQLWREIAAQGYAGSSRMVSRFVETLKTTPVGTASAPVDVPHYASLTAVWLFVRDPATLDAAEQEDLAAFRQASPTLATTYLLVQDFFQMLRQREGERLNVWLAQVSATPLPELHSFAHGVEQDKEAVIAGLTLPINNAQTEGQVTKIKLIKRMMYGRAKFPLLRQRVLHAL